jgi:hypothetical protein
MHASKEVAAHLFPVCVCGVGLLRQCHVVRDVCRQAANNACASGAAPAPHLLAASK